MINDNTYVVDPVGGCMINIKNEESEKKRIILQDQLISILWINPLSGEATVSRGRVDSFKFEVDVNRYRAAHKAVVLDISSKNASDKRVIYIDAILDISSINGGFDDLDIEYVEDPDNVPNTIEDDGVTVTINM